MTGTHYYNPNWGWYEGKRRNARVRDTYEPVFLLSHIFNSADKKVQVTTSLGSSFGHKNTTAFNFVKTDDPRPDYYRYLPNCQAHRPYQPLCRHGCARISPTQLQESE